MPRCGRLFPRATVAVAGRCARSLVWRAACAWVARPPSLRGLAARPLLGLAVALLLCKGPWQRSPVPPNPNPNSIPTHRIRQSATRDS